MTVITKLKQTIAGLKSAQACLEGFVLDTDNKQAKQLYIGASFVIIVRFQILGLCEWRILQLIIQRRIF
ncbi:DUF1657 domain-containing protein [Bacillus mycoides]|uniref:DUF1657 domain-containing protein n=1 Tax=Bacillus cereus group TaxID=86661 RepID=UPI003D207364